MHALQKLTCHFSKVLIFAPIVACMLTSSMGNLNNLVGVNTWVNFISLLQIVVMITTFFELQWEGYQYTCSKSSQEGGHNACISTMAKQHSKCCVVHGDLQRKFLRCGWNPLSPNEANTKQYVGVPEARGWGRETSWLGRAVAIRFGYKCMCKHATTRGAQGTFGNLHCLRSLLRPFLGQKQPLDGRRPPTFQPIASFH